MNPIVHGELSWLVAQGLSRRRDRILVTVAGVLPDLDGLALLGGTDFYGRYHHTLTHGWLAALVLAAGCAALASDSPLRRGREEGRAWLGVFTLSLVTFHLHLLCDLAGSGPGWPLMYLAPFDRTESYWSGQWDLASWQNGVIGVTTSILCLATAFRWKRTVVEVFSLRADREVVRALWLRFRRREPA